MLRSLNIFPILQGLRGQAGVDLEALTATLVNLSRLAVDYPEIRELDLNPVVAAPQGCWCVDCRIVL
jgi:acetyltransferase